MKHKIQNATDTTIVSMLLTHNNPLFFNSFTPLLLYIIIRGLSILHKKVEKNVCKFCCRFIAKIVDICKIMWYTIDIRLKHTNSNEKERKVMSKVKQILNAAYGATAPVQKYSSAATSINSKKIPAVFSLVTRETKAVKSQ